MLKILVAVDGSDCSLRAVDYLIDKLHAAGAAMDIHLLTVHPPIPYARAVAMIGHDKVNQYYQEEGLEALKPAQGKLDAAGIKYGSHVGVGDPARIIAEYAKEKHCDQILMGSHGRGRIGSVVMGSVASKLLHLTSLPVQLVH
jgi:nucleotide-binding universal stress UspA family protein